MMKHNEAKLPHCLTVGDHMGGEYATKEAAEKMGKIMAKHHSLHHGESLPISVKTNDLESGLKGMPNESTEGMGEMYGKLAGI